MIYRGWSTFEIQKVGHSQYLKNLHFFQKMSKNKRVLKIDFRTFLFLYFFWEMPSFLRYWEWSTFLISKVDHPLYIKNGAFNQKKSRNKKGRNWFFRLKGMLFGCVYMLFNSQSRFQKWNWQLKKTSNFFQVLIPDLKSAWKNTSETPYSKMHS